MEKIFTDKQQLATGFACSSRTVSPDEHCYRLILHQGIEEIICAAANTDGGACLLPMAHFLQNNWPTSFYQIVSGFWLQRIFWSQFSAPRHKMKECVVEFVHQRHPPLHGFRMHSLHGLSGRTHLHIQILYATCLCTKILFVVNCCHVQRCGRCRRVSFNTKTHNRLASSLASSLKTECNTMWNRAWAHASKLVANGPRNGGPCPEGRSCALDRRCTILSNRRPSSHE